MEIFIKNNPALSILIASGILTLIGILVKVVSDLLVARITGSQGIILEREKLNSNLIVKAIDTDNPKKSLNSLKFLLALGVITDKDKKLQNILDGKTDIDIPALKTRIGRLIASNEGSWFSVQSGFDGQCKVKYNEIEVELKDGNIKLTDKYNQPLIFIVSVSIGLARNTVNGWEIFQHGEFMNINREIKKNEQIQIPSCILKVDRSEYDDIKGYWLVFTIAQRSTKEDARMGTSYVHFKHLDKL